MKMKTKRKALLLSLCAVLLVVASVMGTMAYLTSTPDAVVNTFTVGQVRITLDELDVDNSTKDAERDQANSYLLVPGKKYTKDPTVHVDPVSEDSYIFVKVENGLAAIEADAVAGTGDDAYTKIADQITGHGWTALDGVANVYYKSYTKSDDGENLVVFDNFKVSGTANNNKEIWGSNAQITVTAYAVQSAGFDNAKEAWTAAKFA